MDKYELVERYEALGDEDDFVAAKRLFDQELTGQSSALDHRQYGYLLECHGRRAFRRAVDQYEQAMALDPDQDKVQYQWMSAKASLGEPEDAITRYRDRAAGSAGDVRGLRLLSSAYLQARGDADGALADWRRAHELDPEDFGPVYMSAFLLEHEGRLADAAEAWRHILEYADARGWELTAIWPRQELQRLLDELQHPGR